MRVQLEGLSKKYDDYEAVCDVSLSIESGEFMVLLGPSGSGKTTTLRMIAGLSTPDTGLIRFDDRVVNMVHPAKRDIAMVFQDYALYPHKTVYDNIGFNLRVRKEPKAEIQRRVTDVATLLRIDSLLNRKPGQLSGGERQRVALGRAIVRNPAVFLMDEPLSNLDAKLREDMRVELREIQRRLDVTTIYVTHDQVEAMVLADRIAIMDQGCIQQVGTPSDVYNFPANLFVAEFVGTPRMNLVQGRLLRRDDGLVFAIGDETYAESHCEIPQPPDVAAQLLGCGVKLPLDCLLGFRAEAAQVRLDATESAGIPVVVQFVENLGSDQLIVSKLLEPCRNFQATPALVVRADFEPLPSPGEQAFLVPSMARACLFDRSSGHSLYSAGSCGS
jgi:multiple sugar transport system ATP-binding protein